MHISVVTDDAEEFRFDTDSAPAPGDRIIHEETPYRVEERTWHVDSLKSEAWIELLVSVE